MSDSSLLAERAAHYCELILDVACGPGGLIISFPRFDTRRPFQEGEEPPLYTQDRLDRIWGGNAPKATAAESLYGENTLWVTGWFLWSQILRYRTTREQEALDNARKCFRDLNHIFRLCRQIEPGLLGKPIGGRASPNTSNDQAACPVLFYVQYAQEMASPEEKAEAVENMALHGEYYLRRNWVMVHHGNLARVVESTHTSVMKYLACVHAAYELTGQTRFRDAAFKYLRQILAAGNLPWPSNPYEINPNITYYYGMLCDYWSRTEMGKEANWTGFVGEYWRATQQAFDEEGLPRFGQYDHVQKTFTAYPEGWMNREEAIQLGVVSSIDISQDPTGKVWVSPTSAPTRALSCVFAPALALLARAHGFDENAHKAAKRILLRMDEESLRLWWNLDGKMPVEWKSLLNIFAPEVAAIWLVGYWMGRWQGVW